MGDGAYQMMYVQVEGRRAYSRAPFSSDFVMFSWGSPGM